VCAALAASPQHIEWLAWGSAWLDRIEARRSGHFDLTDFGRFLAVGNEALGTALKQSKTRTKVMGRPAQSSLGHRVAKLMAHGMQEEQASHAVAAYSGATPAKVRKSLLWVRREVEKVEARTAATLKKSKPPNRAVEKVGEPNAARQKSLPSVEICQKLPWLEPRYASNHLSLHELESAQRFLNGTRRFRTTYPARRQVDHTPGGARPHGWNLHLEGVRGRRVDGPAHLFRPADCALDFA
jgi:hypothetical protein